MSARETPMIQEWWARVGGRICEEVPVVPYDQPSQRRRIDAVVLPNRPTAWISHSQDFGPLRGERAIVVQAKASALSPPLLGQAVFSSILATRYLGVVDPGAVALCSVNDADLAPLAAERDVEVVEMPAAGSKSPFRLSPNRERLAIAAQGLAAGALHLNIEVTPKRLGATGQRAHALIVREPSWRPGIPLEGLDVTMLSEPGNGGFGMWVLGQAVFVAELLRRVHRPSSVRSVVVVPRDDAAIRLRADAERIDVMVLP